MQTNTQSDPFFIEYTSDEAIQKYTKATAGYGISFLLENDYKEVYMNALNLIPAETRRRGIRVLEFGCGGGMNLVHLLSILGKSDTKVERAFGTDFSPVLIEAARKEAKTYLSDKARVKPEFFVGLNETLVQDLSAGTGLAKAELEGSFHFIFGVNTFRYCHRAKKELDCTRDIYKLLAPGGVCVNIDMSDRFLFFRSAIKNRLGITKESDEECFIPSLQQYVTPFEQAGFKVLRQGHFCWIPHSAGPFMCRFLRAMTPLLNGVASSRAMRSVVVAQKPAAAK